MFASGKGADDIVKERGIEQLSDASAIEALCDQVIAANPKPAADFKAGNAASLNFLKGQVMKLSKGKANPQLAGAILVAQVEELKKAPTLNAQPPKQICNGTSSVADFATWAGNAPALQHL